MKHIIKAISIKGNVVEGSGFAYTSEKHESGRDISILFISNVEWQDCSELYCDNFVYVFSDSIKIIQ